MAAVPSPASLEKMPREAPRPIASERVEPTKPPTAGAGAKAYLKIMPKAEGTLPMLAMMTTRQPRM